MCSIAGGSGPAGSISLSRIWAACWGPLGPIVGRCKQPYVVRSDRLGGSNAGTSMADTVSGATSLLSRPLVLVAALAGIVLAGTLALWAHYGTAVFYEMIVAGIAACL
jgi:hypothetical protein